MAVTSLSPAVPAARLLAVGMSVLLWPAPWMPPVLPVAPDDGAAARAGRGLAGRYQCGACHVIPGVAAADGVTGPSLAHFARRIYIAGQVPNDRETLQRWIQAPSSVVPGTTMPALGVSRADAAAIAAFLHSLE
jgi:cytochrome c